LFRGTNNISSLPTHLALQLSNELIAVYGIHRQIRIHNTNAPTMIKRMKCFSINGIKNARFRGLSAYYRDGCLMGYSVVYSARN
jgi:hypothetical protein